MVNQSGEIAEGTVNEKSAEEETDFNFESAKDIQNIRWLLQNQDFEYAVPFNTNILRIALNVGEERIAEMLVYKYNIAIDEKMLIRSIKTRQMNFLYSVWAYNKNYEYIAEDDEDEDEDDDDQEEDGCKRCQEL